MEKVIEEFLDEQWPSGSDRAAAAYALQRLHAAVERGLPCGRAVLHELNTADAWGRRVHRADVDTGDAAEPEDGREVCECGMWADECDRDHEAEAAGGYAEVIYRDGSNSPLCPVCHSTGCEHEPQD